MKFASPQGGKIVKRRRKPPPLISLASPMIGADLQRTVVRNAQTASSRQRRTLRGVTLWCRKNRHQPTHEQHRQLCQKLQGHYAYYGIIGNSRSIASVRHKVLLIWHKWLSRRSRGSPDDVGAVHIHAQWELQPSTSSNRSLHRCSESANPRNRMPERRASGSVGAPLTIEGATRQRPPPNLWFPPSIPFRP